MNLLRIEQVIEKTTLGRRSVYNYMKAGRFPAPVRLGDRHVRWVEDEVNAWLRARAGERTTVRAEGVAA